MLFSGHHICPLIGSSLGHCSAITCGDGWRAGDWGFPTAIWAPQGTWGHRQGHRSAIWGPHPPCHFLPQTFTQKIKSTNLAQISAQVVIVFQVIVVALAVCLMVCARCGQWIENQWLFWMHWPSSLFLPPNVQFVTPAPSYFFCARCTIAKY